MSHDFSNTTSRNAFNDCFTDTSIFFANDSFKEKFKILFFKDFSMSSLKHDFSYNRWLSSRLLQRMLRSTFSISFQNSSSNYYCYYYFIQNIFSPSLVHLSLSNSEPYSYFKASLGKKIHEFLQGFLHVFLQCVIKE